MCYAHVPARGVRGHASSGKFWIFRVPESLSDAFSRVKVWYTICLDVCVVSFVYSTWNSNTPRHTFFN